MPIHDWSRVDANLFHHFHQAWTIRISDALNNGLLPPGYAALVEQHTAGVVPDASPCKPGRRPTARRAEGGGVVAVAPKTRHVIRAQQEISANRGNRITSATRSAAWSASSRSSRPATRGAGPPCGRSSRRPSISCGTAFTSSSSISSRPGARPAGDSQGRLDKIEDQPLSCRPTSRLPSPPTSPTSRKRPTSSRSASAT